MSQLGFNSEGPGAGGSVSMEVAFWVEPSLLAGELTFVRHLITGLRSEGQRITLIAPQGLSLSELPVLGSRVLTYRWNRWEKLPVLQKLRLNALARQLNDAPPDLLVVWGAAATGGGSGAAALAVLSQMVPTLPIVLWCWDAAELFTPIARLASVRHIIASSQPIAARAGAGAASGGGGEESSMSIGGGRKTARGAAGAGGGGAVTAPVTVVHPGVYCEDTLACFDVEGQMACLVSLDPLSSRPAYEALLRACRQLADRRQEFLLFAYDKGAAEYPIWRLGEELRLLDRLSFVPFQQDAEPLLLHGDLYIHVVPASRVQYRTLEAMGRGLAVVTCPNHSADYLIDGQTCRSVGPQTPEAWCEALQELLADRTKAAAIARRGQQHVRERHSMARTLEQFGSICRQVAGMAIPLAGR